MHHFYINITTTSSAVADKLHHSKQPFISSLQVIIDISNLIPGLNIASPSLPMTNRPKMGVATSCDPS